MATANLSNYNINDIPDAGKLTFGIVVAQWNSEITEALFEGAYQTLRKFGVKHENIIRIDVPGSFELTFGAKHLIENTLVNSVIAIGAVIRGETPHFDYISQAVTYGLTQLNVQYNVPVIFGVLTTDNLEQAKQRAGGKYGNKGVEAAITAIKMANLNLQFKN